MGIDKTKKMEIFYGQKVKLTIKRDIIKDGKPVFGKVEEETIEGQVSGIFQKDWLTVYSQGKHFVIDLR